MGEWQELGLGKEESSSQGSSTSSQGDLKYPHE